MHLEDRQTGSPPSAPETSGRICRKWGKKLMVRPDQLARLDGDTNLKEEKIADALKNESAASDRSPGRLIPFVKIDGFGGAC